MFRRWAVRETEVNTQIIDKRRLMLPDESPGVAFRTQLTRGGPVAGKQGRGRRQLLASSDTPFPAEPNFTDILLGWRRGAKPRGRQRCLQKRTGLF